MCRTFSQIRGAALASLFSAVDKGTYHFSEAVFLSVASQVLMPLLTKIQERLEKEGTICDCQYPIALCDCQYPMALCDCQYPIALRGCQ